MSYKNGEKKSKSFGAACMSKIELEREERRVARLKTVKSSVGKIVRLGNCARMSKRGRRSGTSESLRLVQPDFVLPTGHCSSSASTKCGLKMRLKTEEEAKRFHRKSSHKKLLEVPNEESNIMDQKKARFEAEVQLKSKTKQKQTRQNKEVKEASI